MAKGQLYSYYKNLPPWGKGVVGVGGAIIVAVIGFKVYNAVKDAKARATMSQEASRAAGDLSDLVKKGVSPTYSNSQYESWSNQLVNAFTGCGTDVSVVTNVFNNLQNEADLLKLISTYGIRPYQKCFSFAYVLGGGTVSVSLSAALSDELSQPEIDTINNILASKGIKYRF